MVNTPKATTAHNASPKIPASRWRTPRRRHGSATLASTPSNAAELLVPDRAQVLAQFKKDVAQLEQVASRQLRLLQADVVATAKVLDQAWHVFSTRINGDTLLKKQLLKAFNPRAALARGYALVRQEDSGAAVTSVKSLQVKDRLSMQLKDGTAGVAVTSITKTKRL